MIGPRTFVRCSSEARAKQWMAAIGERNSGKGFLLQLMVAAFGSYVKSCNSENFLYTGPTKDPAKQQSWMLDFEFSRLCYSNEITIDPQGEAKLDGNQIKRFSSGGDELCARKNFKVETYFRTQAHQLICCNDLCSIEPSDAKHQGITFDMPSCFVDKGDPRLGTWTEAAGGADNTTFG
jgi:phage/plasmid-associated DNA primase